MITLTTLAPCRHWRGCSERPVWTQWQEPALRPPALAALMTTSILTPAGSTAPAVRLPWRFICAHDTHLTPSGARREPLRTLQEQSWFTGVTAAAARDVISTAPHE